MKYLFSILFSFYAFGVIAQETLVPTEDQALLSIIVSDMEENPRPKDKIIFEGKLTKLAFEGVADEEGKFSILLPEGDIYLIKIQGLGSTIDFDELRIPKQEGIVSGKLAVRYRPARTFNLDDVHFETQRVMMFTKDELLLIFGNLFPNMKTDYNLQYRIISFVDMYENLQNPEDINTSEIVDMGYGSVVDLELKTYGDFFDIRDSYAMPNI